MNAIILAAGLGSRLLPITSIIPKPLIKINEQTIIERQISFLNSINVTNIYIVVGYLHEQFEYLKARYGVTLIYNPNYKSYNNFYSLYLAREFFGDSYILEGDVFICRNFLKDTITHSTYFSGFTKDCRSEWVLQFDHGKLKSILTPGMPGHYNSTTSGAYVMTGVSYWNFPDAKLIVGALTNLVENMKAAEHPLNGLFWDHAVLSNQSVLDIRVNKIGTHDWHEIDTLTDLEKLAGTYKNVLQDFNLQAK